MTGGLTSKSSVLAKAEFGAMPRKKKTNEEPAPRRRRSLIVVALVLLVVGGVVLALDRLGGEALRRIGLHGRYRVHFADIQCDAPRGMERAAFLTEVRYLSEFPEVFHALDEAERQRLAAAFARHPWVERVEGVAVEPGTVVRVKLVFRDPVLAVRVEGAAVRLVDSHAILLPESPAPRDIAELLNTVPAPKVTAGEVWPDELVQRSLDLMKSYPIAKLERISTGWRLELKDGTTATLAK